MGLNAVWVGCHRTPLFQRKIKKVRLCEMTVVFSEACEVVATAFLFLFFWNLRVSHSHPFLMSTRVCDLM